MNDVYFHPRFTFHSYEYLVSALTMPAALLALELIYHITAHADAWMIAMILIPTYFYIFPIAKHILFPISISEDGIRLPKEADDSDERQRLNLGWDEINTVSLIKGTRPKERWRDLSSVQILVYTTQGKKHTYDVEYYLFLREKKFRKAFEICSGKKLGEEISPRIRMSKLADTGNYEVEERDGFEGIVDSETGKVMLPFKYHYIDGLALEDKCELVGVGKGERYGFVDTKTWQIAIPIKYPDCYTFSEGLVAVGIEEGKWRFVDRNDKVVIPGPFEDADNFSEGLCDVKKGGKYGYIDRGGRMVISCQFDNASIFKEGLAAAAMADTEGNLRYGYINKSGSVEIGYRYSKAQYFSEGLAGVEIGGRWGFINKEGLMAIAPQYHEVYPFENGKAEVTTRGLLGTRLGRKTIHIDTHGNPVK